MLTYKLVNAISRAGKVHIQVSECGIDLLQRRVHAADGSTLEREEEDSLSMRGSLYKVVYFRVIAEASRF